ncbi:hypothetical protein MNBD_GAMMA07-282 [hydrothermal vent metagenome]|uniref:SMP-30/Gluconolactonase/LRE-like region domain-containing protein n=1 Tax=hydrothermal vent metagenome TaxID=652676 RepID=A0A3B0WP43_9ZZZZ
MKSLHLKKTIKSLFYSTLIISAIGLTSTVSAWERGKTKTFTLLPAGSAAAEGITKDADNNIYVSTLQLPPQPGNPPLPGQVHKFNLAGQLLSTIDVTPSSGMLLDLDFHPNSGKLLILDMGTGQVLDVNPITGDAVVFSQLPDLTPNNPNAGPLPNVLTFDAVGNVYVSDSIQSTIWRIPPDGGTPEAWLSHDLLGTQSYPPFGANGLDFNKDFSILYVANTGDDAIVEVPILADGTPGTPFVMAYSVDSPDGLIVDDDGTILIASFHGNHIMRVNTEGTAINVYSDFDGVDSNGVIKGVLTPSDIVTINGNLYVPNLALNITAFEQPEHVTSFYTGLVERNSIAKIKPKKNAFRTHKKHHFAY